MSDIHIICNRFTEEMHEADGLDVSYRLLGLVAVQGYAGAMVTVALLFSLLSLSLLRSSPLPCLFLSPHCAPSPTPSIPSLSCPPSLVHLLPFCSLPAFSGTYGFSPTQTQYSYSMSQVLRGRTQSEDVNDALLNLDRVLQGESVCMQHTQSCPLSHHWDYSRA